MLQNPDMFERLDESINSLKYSIVSHTKKTEKHTDNQDAVLIQRFPEGQILLGVFDGLGGHVSGEEASQTAVEIIQRESRYMPNTIEEIQLWMQQSLIKSNQTISQINNDRSGMRIEHNAESLKKRMGTTATLACIFKRNLIIGNVGNSRCYVYENGMLTCITLDDIEYLSSFKRQRQDTLDSIVSLDGKDMITRLLFQCRSGISKALGLRMDSTPNIYTKELFLTQNPLILLTTDGIHHNLTTEEILAVIKDCEINDPQNVAQKLVEISKKRALIETEHIRSHDDDMTVVACWIS